MGVLRGHLTAEKERVSTKKVKQRYEIALYYAKQAEQFSKAARFTELPTKSTLLYYSMMNLVKSYLQYRNVDVGSHHGIMQLHDDRGSKRIRLKAPNYAVSTFEMFSNEMNGYFHSGKEFTFEELTSKILEVHKLDNLWSSKSRQLNYLPINLRYVEYKGKKNKLYNLHVNIEEKHLGAYDVGKFLANGRERVFSKLDDSILNYRLRKSRKINYANLENNLNSLSKNELYPLQFLDLLDNDGYVHYCYLGDPTFHHLCYPYLFMFYVGYHARYFPMLSDEMMKGEKYAIISEAVKQCPPQFVYQLLSRFLGRRCVVPKGSGIQY